MASSADEKGIEKPAAALHGHHDPHAGDAASGHAMLFGQMMLADAAEHRAIASGAWSKPATWSDGKIPKRDSRVFIPKDISVVVDREFPEALYWVRVDGVLRFATDVNTSLVVDSLAVAPEGRLEIGTKRHPIKADVTSRLIFAARGGKPIDHAWDPLELGRGLLAQGIVESHGAAKTPFVAVSAMPAPASTTIDVDQAPRGWRPGDDLVLTATAYDEDETFKLVAVDEKRITIDRPLRNKRTLPTDPQGKPYPGPALHLANLTRNVVIASSATSAGDVKLQGHVMLMHSGGHQLAWTGFYDLGRTTIKPVTDPTIHDGHRDAGISLEMKTATENVRGRYSLHFHRAGAASTPSAVLGCAVVVKRGSGLKIGVVNHSSNVSVRDCVSHNIDGSHYFTEEGDELGDFTGNLAIHSVGSGTSHDEQPRDVMLRAQHTDPEWYHRRRLDVGHRGTGYWINGGGVAVINNIAAGQAHSGFHVWTRTLGFRLDKTYTVRFPTTGLPDPTWTSAPDLDIGDVPMKFNGNAAYVLASGKHRGIAGFIIDYYGMHVRSRFPKAPFTEVYDLLSWNAHGLRTSYAGNLHFKNVHIIGDGAADDVGINLRTQGGNSDLIEGLRIEGFARGMIAPAHSVIKGGHWRATVGLWLHGGQGTVVDLAGMKFAEPNTSAKPQFDLYRDPILSGDNFNPVVAFAPQPLEVRGHPGLPAGAELYSLEQMPEYMLPDLGIAGLLDGRTTTREAWEKHRLAPGGAVAPPDAAPLAGVRTNGIFGSPARYDAAIGYRDTSSELVSFRPQVGFRTRKGSIDAPVQDLKPGWNLLSIDVDGATRTILIHGGPAPRRPFVQAGPDQTVAADEGVRLAGKADGKAELRWSRAYGPGAVEFTDAASAQTKATFDKPGTYVLHLTARDTNGVVNTDSVLILVETPRR